MTIACPACGEAEQLRGERGAEGVRIRCETCGHRWTRDPDRCPACGERKVADVREPLYQKARGTQQSIIGYHIVKECYGCGHRQGVSQR